MIITQHHVSIKGYKKFIIAPLFNWYPFLSSIVNKAGNSIMTHKDWEVFFITQEHIPILRKWQDNTAQYT